MTKQSKVRGIHLPSEFDIDKYLACEDFTFSDWARNIAERMWRVSYRETLMRSPRQDLDSPEERDSYRSLFLNDWLEVLSNPLDLQRGAPLQDLSFNSEQSEKLVRDMDVMDYMIIRHSRDQYDGGSPAKIESYDTPYLRWCEHSGQPGDDAMLAESYWQVTYAVEGDRNIVHSHGTIHATINLHASETRLVEDFLHWVRQTKQALDMPAQARLFTDADRQKWHRNRILAYFDLKHWSTLAGIKIPAYQMALILFPEETELDNPAEKIRDTVRVRADEIFNKTMVSALIDQAMKEEAK